MERGEQDFKLEYPINWTYEVAISQVKKDIEELEKLGATHIEIDHGITYGCSYVLIYSICRRIETNEEFENRKKEVEKMQEQYKQKLLQQIAKLNAK
jgi:aerobic-type carbon monoxide dehydrogenase small subunit (CoxS/CutS family)